MRRPDQNDPIWQLVDLATLGELSEEQSRHFNELLREDQVAQELYLEYVQLQCELQSMSRRQPLLEVALEATKEHHDNTRAGRQEEEGESPGHMTVRPRSTLDRFQAAIDWRRYKLRFGVFALVVTVLLWIGIQLIVRPEWWHRDDIVDVNRSGETQPVVVAKLTDLYNATWADESKAIRRGAYLLEGMPIELESGVIEITFRRGAVVVVEGPAEFHLGAMESGTLKAGKLTARVPRSAVGFSVNTAMARIVDLGTAFGVAVDPTGADVYVQTGKVAVVPSGADKDKQIVLNEGNSLRIDKDGQARPRANRDAEKFVWAAPKSQPVGKAAIAYDGTSLDATNWVEQGWGTDGYLFFGTNKTESPEGKTLGIHGLLRSGDFFTDPVAVAASEDGTMTTHGSYPGSRDESHATAAVAIERPGGDGAFKPGGVYRRRIEEAGIQGVFRIRFTRDIPHLRIAVLMGNQWVSSRNAVPPELRLTLSHNGIRRATSPVVTPDGTAASARADWYFFNVTGIARGDELTVGGRRMNPNDRRYVHIGGLAFQMIDPSPQPVDSN